MIDVIAVVISIAFVTTVIFRLWKWLWNVL